MSQADVKPGKILRLENAYQARLERSLGCDPDKVWTMLTEPQALAQWLAPGTIDLRKGGRVHLDFSDSGTVIDSTVLQIEPLRLIEYSWSSVGEPERPLRWELERVDAGSHLVLTLRVPADEDVARACAGFDAHLEMFVAALEGVSIRFPVDHFLEARRLYLELTPA